MDPATIAIAFKIVQAVYPILGDRAMDFITGKTSTLEIKDVEITPIDEALVSAGIDDEFIDAFYRRAGVERPSDV